ncbi:glutathione S-transferase [Hyphomonas sp.]|uniref:glutathione S-transferase n=1 Tax=Hyphomonas sp. TaxID=87 RepID=UPI003242F7FD
MPDAATPILYTFRRCPYAMRARLALSAAQLDIRVREVVLRDKPAAMLEASPKGTVPVLVLESGEVIDESLDVMRWALAENDPEGWLEADAAETDALIAQNDGPFKRALDRYKYPNRYEDEGADPVANREAGLAILKGLSEQIAAHGGQLFGPAPTLADMAIFPFVRQFAHTDMDWWEAAAPGPVKTWLAGHKESTRFRAIMKKYPQWAPGEAEPALPLSGPVAG